MKLLVSVLKEVCCFVAVRKSLRYLSGYWSNVSKHLLEGPNSISVSNGDPTGHCLMLFTIYQRGE